MPDLRWGLVLKILYNKLTHKNHIWHKIKHGGTKVHTCVCAHVGVHEDLCMTTCDMDNIYLLKRLETLKNASQFNVKKLFLKP